MKTVIEMAREAGWKDLRDYDSQMRHDFFLGSLDSLERFAEIVRADEREKVARWQIGSGYATGHGDTIEDLLVELEWQVREAEREACTKVADGYIGADPIAEAIRARGNT